MAAETLAAAIMALIPTFEQTLDTTIIVNDTGYTGIEVKEWKRSQACEALGIQQCDFPLGYFNHYQNPNGDSDVMDFTMPNGQTGSICFLNMPVGSNETHATLSYLDGRMPMRDFIYENQRAAYTPSSGDLRAFNLLMQISGCASPMWLGDDDSTTMDRDVAFSAMFHQLANGDPSFLAEAGDTGVRYLVEGMRSDVGMTALGETQRILVEHWKVEVAEVISAQCGAAIAAEGSGPLYAEAKPIGYVSDRVGIAGDDQSDARAAYMSSDFLNGQSSGSFSGATIDAISDLRVCLNKTNAANIFQGSNISVTEELLEFLIPSYPKLYVGTQNQLAPWSSGSNAANTAPGNPGVAPFFMPMVQYGPFEVFGGDGSATLQYAWNRANQLAGIVP